MLNCVPRRPFEVKSWAQQDRRRAAPEAAGREAHRRLLVRRPGDAEARRDLVGQVHASGISPVRLKEPLALRSFGLRIGSSGLSSALEAQAGGHREVGRHEPLVLEEERGLLLAEVGPSGLDRGQAAEAAELPVLAATGRREDRPALLKMKTPRQLPRKTWSIEVSLYSKPRLGHVVAAQIGQRVAERLALGGRDDRQEAHLAVAEPSARDLDLGQVQALVLARRVLGDVVDVECR